MTERDIELHRQAGWSDSKLIELVRADAMEAATRAATASWTLICKKMVEFEREACAKLCDDAVGTWNGWPQAKSALTVGAMAIRARRAHD